MAELILQRDCLGIPMYIGNEVAQSSDKLRWYGNPDFAIKFNTEYEANKFRTEVANCPDAHISSLTKAQKAWTNRCKSGHAGNSFQKLTPATSQAIKLTGNHAVDRKAVLHWWLKEYTIGSNVVQEVYRDNSAAMYRTFKVINNSGYWTDTMQTALCIHFTSSDINVKQLAEDMSVAVTFIQPDKQGLRKFEVLEPSCSQFESYHIEEKNGNWKLQTQRRKSTVISSPHLTDFLTKVQNFFIQTEEPSED